MNPSTASPATFTHVINIFSTPPNSPHALAQAVTIQTIKSAREAAALQGIEVELVAVCFEADVSWVDPAFKTAILPDRTVLNFGTFKKPRPIPLLRDIIETGAKAGSKTFMIYSNIDIAVQRNFYVRLAEMIDKGRANRGIVINRRTVMGPYSSLSEIEQMYADPGIQHPGYDCWTFPRNWSELMRFGNVCVGNFWFDLLMLANMDLLGRHGMIIFKNQHLTFHIGDDVGWDIRSDYSEHNRAEAIKAVTELQTSQNRRPIGTWTDWLRSKLQNKPTKLRRILLETRRVVALRRFKKHSGCQWT